MGSRHDLFGGACAVRNCGLSSATIREMTTRVEAAPDRNPETVVSVCGINNLGFTHPVKLCVSADERLLAVARALKPWKVIVSSVTPVPQASVDQQSRKLNQTVFALGKRLAKLCGRHNAVFVNVNGAVTNDSGRLADELTTDGLNLHGCGYRRIADVIRGHLIDEATGQK